MIGEVEQGDLPPVEKVDAYPLSWALNCPTCGDAHEIDGVPDEGIATELKFFSCECGQVIEAMPQNYGPEA